MAPPLPSHVAAARRARRGAWTWPRVPCPPDLAGPHRAGAEVLHPLASPRRAADVRRFVAAHYPHSRWTLRVGNVLMAACLLGYAGWIYYEGRQGGVALVAFAGMLGALFFTVPAILIYRGFLLLGRRGAGDAGISSMAMLRNDIVRRRSAEMLVDLRLARMGFADLAAIVQDPFLVLAPYHRALLEGAAPLAVAWFLTVLCAATPLTLEFHPLWSPLVFASVAMAARRLAVPMTVGFVGENLREMITWLTLSAHAELGGALGELRLYLLRVVALTLLPLVLLALLVAGALWLPGAVAPGLHIPVTMLALGAWGGHRAIARRLYLRSVREMRALRRRGDDVLDRAVARLAELRDL